MENAITLPYDKVTEDAVLGSVINNEGEYEAVAKYFSNLEVFYQDRAKLLWKKIKYMKSKNEVIDTRTVTMSLTQYDINRGLNHHYVVGCTGDTCLKGMTELYAKKLYDKFLMRQVVVKAEEIKTNTMNNRADIYQTISETHSILGEILNTRPSIASNIEDVIEWLVSETE